MAQGIVPNGDLMPPSADANGALTPSESPKSEEASMAASSQPAVSAPPSTSTPLEAQSTPASSDVTNTTNGVEEEKDTEEEWHLPTDGPLKTPIPRPLGDVHPPAPVDLTPEQATKYATVLAAVSQWTTLPSTTARNAPQAPIQDHERMWLTRECLLRYLRATKWNTANALKRLQNTLSWRREYGADTFTFDYISPENETGKQVILGYDKEARPCLFLNPAKQNTKMSDRQIHHLCFMLDRTVDMMPAGQENSALIINFKGASTGNTPSVGQARQVLNILQGHNPERLGKALISELPWYVNTFFKLISPFIDPVTREKMKFNEDLRKYVPAAMLWDHHDGELNFEYDHKVYWAALEKETTRRRESMRQRWEKAGKHIGEYEAYLRGGEQPSIQQIIDESGMSGEIEKSTDPDLAAAEVAKLSIKS